MSHVSSDVSIDGGARCPTCGAHQEWSDTCRRCKCDLTLLRSVASAVRFHRRRCLALLQRSSSRDALVHARRLYLLSPDPQAARLLAVCHLLNGEWTAAFDMARIAESS